MAHSAVVVLALSVSPAPAPSAAAMARLLPHDCVHEVPTGSHVRASNGTLRVVFPNGSLVEHLPCASPPAEGWSQRARWSASSSDASSEQRVLAADADQCTAWNWHGTPLSMFYQHDMDVETFSASLKMSCWY